MKVRNYSALLKLKYFGLGYLTALVVLIFIKLYKVDFDYKVLEISAFEIFVLAIVSAIPAFQMNKVKYIISQIDNINDFLKWLYEYFEKFNGKVISRSNDLIIFEVEETSKRIFNKRKKSYYKVKMHETKAVVEGPSYNKPITNDSTCLSVVI